MTQEEKARAYDEALERARKMLNMILDEELLGFPDQIREIFPQLKESKDEKIREEMIRYFTEMKEGGSAALPYDDCIAYLEKQKDLDKMIVVSPEVWDKAISDAYENGKKDGEKQKEQKPADEAEKFFDSAESYNQGFVAGQKKMKEDIEKGFGISEHSLDYLTGRYAGYAAARQEQKPAALSEMMVHKEPYIALVPTPMVADEQKFGENHTLEFEKAKAKYEGIVEGKQTVLDNPEDYGLCKPAEWSEKDEERLKAICTYLQDYPRLAKINDVKRFNGYCDWLKSLHPQPSWKPSEEQVKAFKKYIEEFQARAEAAVGGWNNFDVMIQLYEQLKKLQS